MTTENPVAPTPVQAAQTKDAQQQNSAAQAAKEEATTNGAATNGVQEEEDDVDDEDLPKRVYVGNLSFKTDEDSLKAAFGKLGAVKSATIVKVHNARSLGYGFVTFEADGVAEKAIETLHKSQLDERTISVQRARTKAEIKEKREARKKRLAEHRAKAKAKAEAAAAKANENGENSGEAQEGDAPKKRGSITKGRGRRTERPKRERGPPSTTTIFVGNLPWSITDEEFSKLAQDEGVTVTSAYVVRNRFGRLKGRSKGFGFIELASEDEQKKAVEKLHGKEVNERNLSVRIALEKKPQTNGNAGEAEQAQANGDAEVKTEVKTEVKQEA